jgi:sugar phosphate isomerase/epimerase
MKASVSMWSMDRRVQPENFNQLDFINWAKSAGLKYVELVSYYMEKEKNLDEVISLLKKTDIKVSCYTILTDFTVSSDKSAEELRRDLNVAKKIKAPFVRVIAGEQNPDVKSAKENIIRGLGEAARMAAALDITLILENVGKYSGHSTQIKALLNEVGHDSLRANFDTANSLLFREDPEKALANFLPYTAYVHFKDLVSEKDPNFETILRRDEGRVQKSSDNVRFTGITAGEGIVPLSSLMKKIKESGYKGFVSIEYEGTGDSRKDTEASLEYLRSMI